MLTLSSYFGYEISRPAEGTFSARLPLHDGLRDATGALSAGAATFAADLATGGAMEWSVADHGMWVVTSDLDLGLVAPVVRGPLRVDAEVLRTGKTSVVSRFLLHDEEAVRVVGGGTATARPLPYADDVKSRMLPLGAVGRPGGDAPPITTPLAEQLGLRSCPDGAVELPVSEWLRNPWGILHGGVLGCLADASADAAATAAMGTPVRVRRLLLRFLAPVRVGPARAVPTVLTVEGGTAQLEVRILDVGNEGRLCALAMADVVAQQG